MANGQSTSPKEVSTLTEPRLVAIQPLSVHSTINDSRAAATRLTGTIQIASAVTAAVVMVIGMFFTADSWAFNAIRCPFSITFVVYCLSGMLAIGAGTRRTPSLITIHMAAAMLSTIAAIYINILVAGTLFIGRSGFIFLEQVDDNGTFKPENSLSLSSMSFASHLLLTVLVLVTSVQLVTSVWGSSLAARTVCCPKKAGVQYELMEAGSCVATLAGKPYIMAPIPRPDATKEAGPLPEKTVPEGSQPASEK